MAHVTIRWDRQGNVIRIHTRIVIWRMAACTGVGRIVVVSSGMTKGAIICNRNVRSRERINRTMIKSGRHPRGFSMAILTGGGQLVGSVIRIHCPVIIGLVATHTGDRRVVIVPVMAIITGGSLVRSIQWPVIIVDRECSGLPINCGRVAHGAIRRDHQRSMIWIHARVVIGRVATGTGVGRVVIVPSGMTKGTIVGNRDMRPGKWIGGAVIKRGRYPGRLGMAILTGGGQLVGWVIRIGRAVIISLVTTYAGVRCIVIISIVAGGAIVGDACVCPIQWIIIVVDRESCRLPARRRGMAHGTIRWDHQSNVIGIQARIVIRCMTTRTGIRGVVVIAVVTGIAVIRNRYVRPGEWIDGAVIKS